MDQRLVRTVTLAAALPLLLGCGPGGGAPDARTTPTKVSPSSASVPTVSGPGSAAVAPATSTPGPEDAAQEVRVASRTFVRTVLTIGYPDRTYRQHTDRIEPLMTRSGFEALQRAGSTSKGSEALASLYAQRSRSAPRFTGEVEVSALQGDRATARLAYENVAQRRDGRGWKTVRSLGEGTATIRLVRQGKRWLVEDAS